MFKKTLFSLLILAFSLVPFIVNGESPNSDVAHQIAELQRQIALLQEQLKQLGGNQSGQECYKFEKNMGVGTMNGNDISALRKVLDSEGLGVADKSLTYNEATASAVSAFQIKYRSEILTPNGLTNPTGYVGPATRKVLNRLYGCKYVIPPPPKEKLQVISPNGGESWVKGTEQIIRWENSRNSNRFEGRVSISLITYSANEDCRSRGGTICPQDISSIITIADNVTNTGFFNWSVGKNADGAMIGGSGRRYWLSICVIGSDCDRSNGLFTIVDDSQTGNRPPVISGVSGPITLNVGQTGTWTINAYDPDPPVGGGQLWYFVDWGDRQLIDYGGVNPTNNIPSDFRQTTTFTHSYAVAGVYTVKFLVRDTTNNQVQSTISVRVGNITTQSSIRVTSPNGGEQWPAGSTQRIGWVSNYATVAIYEPYQNDSRKVDLYLDPVLPDCASQIPVCAYLPLPPIVLDKNIPINPINQSYYWIVATDIINNPIPAGRYYVRVCIAGTSDCDSSDQPFMIVNRSSLRGRITFTSGNCMPGIVGSPPGPNPCTRNGVAREVIVRTPIKYSSSHSPYFPGVGDTQIVATAISNSNGEYSLSLPDGEYSIFIKENGREYCNLISLDVYCPVSMIAGQEAEHNVDINYLAAY